MSEETKTQDPAETTQGQKQAQKPSGGGNQKKVTAVVNKTRGPHVVGVQVAQPGETVELTKADLENKVTMSRVRNALKNGTLVEA